MNANEGLVINIPMNSSSGRRGRALADANEAFTSLMGVNEEEAYFNGKIVSNQLVKNEGNR